jgi:hypothetical protein
VVVFSLRLLYPREQQSVFTGQKAGWTPLPTWKWWLARTDWDVQLVYSCYAWNHFRFTTLLSFTCAYLRLTLLLEVGIWVICNMVLRVTFWDNLLRCKLTDVSQEYIFSIFRVKIWAKQENRAVSYLLHADFLLSSFRPLRWRWHFPPKRRLTFGGLHDVISNKIALFVTTVVRTSNPTWIQYIYSKVYKSE